MRVCRPLLQILTLFKKKCHFPLSFPDQTSKLHTRFQTWALGRNYVIITQKILQMNFEFAYFCFVLIHSELKRQKSSYASVVPSKTIPDSRPKWAKCIPVFRPKIKEAQTPYPLGQHVPPPPRAGLHTPLTQG